MWSLKYLFERFEKIKERIMKRLLKKKKGGKGPRGKGFPLYYLSLYKHHPTKRKAWSRLVRSQEDERVAVGIRGRGSPRSGVPARQRPGHGRCLHHRPMEAPSGESHPPFSAWCFPTHFAHLGFFPTFSPPLQDAVVELSEHGVVLIVEETGCLQAKVYLQREVVTTTTTTMNFTFLLSCKIRN